MKICKTDANHKEIMDALRKIPNISVFSSHMVGKGFADIVVGYMGVNYLFEIKDGNKPKSSQKLTKDEIEFHSKWNGQIDIVRNINEVLTILKLNYEYL